MDIINTVIVILPILLSIALLTLAERKVMGAQQQRQGPTTTGYEGILQPITDAIKLGVKEIVIPTIAEPIMFIVPCIWILFTGLASYGCVYFSNRYAIVDMDYGIIYILVISSLTIYGLLFAGYASNSKYSLIGSIRATSSMISYEISIGLIVLGTLYGSSYNIYEILQFQGSFNNLFLNIPLAIMYFISITAETNRVPFDLTEAESELTAGPFTEYSSLPFALFFLAEYSSVLLQSILFVTLFLGYVPFLIHSSFLISLIFSLKVAFIVYLFIWLRATLPRVRWDQLMILCWNYLLPISLIYLLSLLLIFSNLS